MNACNKLLTICLYALFSNLAIPASAQYNYSHSYHHLTIQDGLPSNLIYFLLQDSKGYIWIATDKGVCRYNGKTCTVFTTADGLESNEVFRIAEDKSGKVFFYSNMRLCYYENGKFHAAFQSNDKNFVTVAPFGSLYFSTDNKLCVNYGLYQVAYTFSPFHADTVNLLNAREKIFFRGRKSNRFLTDVGLQVVKNEISNLHLKTAKDSIDFTPFRLELNNDTLYLLSKKAIAAFKCQGQTLVKIKEVQLPSFIYSVNLLRNNGLSISSYKNGTIFNINNQNNNYLFGSFTTHSLIDHEHNYWFGTYNEGIYFLPTTKINLIDKSSGLASNTILSIEKFNDKIVAGHSLGLVSVVSPDKISQLDVGTGGSLKGNFFVNKIVALAPLNKNTMLIGTDNCIVEATETGKGKIKLADQLLNFGSVKKIIAYNDTVVFATAYTVFALPNWNNKINVDHNYTYNKIITIEKETSSSFLVGTSVGLYSVRDVFDSNSVFKQELEELHLKAINDIHKRNKITAICTDSKGIVLLNDNGAYTQITAPQLPTNSVLKSRWQDDSTLLLCTTNGLTKMIVDESLAVHRIETYTIASGLPSNYINDVIATDSVYYIATNEGLAIAPKKINSHVHHPWMDLSDNNKPFNCRSNNKIVLSFQGFSYKSLSNLYYKYKLSGIDKNWHVTKENVLEYFFLPVGDYTFLVKAVDINGNESEHTLVIPIHVIPYWYQTWWFKCLLVLIVFLAFYGIYKYRVAQILRVERLRRKISTDLHDDIGSTLSSINIYSQLAISEKNNTPYIETIQQQTQTIIGNLDDLVWSISPKNDNLYLLAEKIESYARPILAAKSINAHFIIEIETNISIRPDQRNNLYLAFKEMINNIVKHAECKNCYVYFLQKGRQLKFEVKDDGVGFNTATINPHRHGIYGIINRAKQMHGAVNINSEINKGTSIEVSMHL